MKIISDKNQIIELLNHYQVIAMPTDTVYGLLMKATKDNEHVIKNVKSRPENKPLPLVVDSIETLLDVIEVNEQYIDLLSRYLPGGLTIVGKAKLDLNHATLAVRVPNNQLMLDVVKHVGPCWLTSANISGQPACCTVEQVKVALQQRVDYVVEGTCELGIPSTIISLVDDQLQVLRQGSVIIETK